MDTIWTARCVSSTFVHSSHFEFDTQLLFIAEKAIDILGIYLTDTAVAPLTKEYVEIPSPLCTYVGFYENTRASFIELAVYFGSVPVEHIDSLDNKFKKSLQKIIEEGLDMERMKLVLKKERVKVSIDG